MRTRPCRALQQGLRGLRARPTAVPVLAGGREFFSNGIHLHDIEAAAHRSGDSAADQVRAHGGVVLNPHYRNMGNLHGSEYRAYTLPRRVGLPPAADRRARGAGPGPGRPAESAGSPRDALCSMAERIARHDLSLLSRACSRTACRSRTLRSS